ncbi:hypothetical protein AWZ03_001340 [Drosophila navojoa]|uniref:SAP domain-containing protein n=1 Tax=Drosophila navojoa TaxID=7232 RepID=A0A484BTD1_DRONA|nr:uncharacterized protein LOC108649101 [Drosophila navojoa]TDG52059.1 hypothetical protein AWZ03_001340 [Drosophila navojoa]
MPESDVTKMKVADLKRELKLRGLPLNGNKNELQDRLQTALLEGDISLEDSAINDAIGDDVSFTDEDEHKLLGEDHEDLLLKSPVNTPTTTTIPDLSSPTETATDSNPDANATSPPAKKIVLKRNNSQPLLTTVTTATATPSKENAAPDTAGSVAESLEADKPLKTNRKPIVVGGSATQTKDSTSAPDKKLTQLSAQERLEMRAKKFGIALDAKAAAAPAKTASPAVNKSSSASIKANKGNKETEEQQKEALKRRAERFGCVVPEKSPKTTVDERLQKRKERFGNTVGTTTAATSDPKAKSEWAEKARARLERFKIAPAAAAAPTK